MQTLSSRAQIFRTVLSSWSFATDFFSTPRTTISFPLTPTFHAWKEEVKKVNLGPKILVAADFSQMSTNKPSTNPHTVPTTSAWSQDFISHSTRRQDWCNKNCTAFQGAVSSSVHTSLNPCGSQETYSSSSYKLSFLQQHHQCFHSHRIRMNKENPTSPVVLLNSRAQSTEDQAK